MLTKAKDKLLFLAFCIEFKRFYDLYIDEYRTSFETFLPIQLDATCNGFQHMALLSNEDTLFQELNLTKTNNSDEAPNDLYSFLLHKLINTFKFNINKGEIIDEKLKVVLKDFMNLFEIEASLKKLLWLYPIMLLMDQWTSI